MKRILCKMIEIYNPQDIDWMGFRISKNNHYTYHHIQEKKYHGDLTIENGAILTQNAHRLLNILEKKYPKAYEDYQNLFRRINDLHGPLTNDLLEDIYGMMLDLLYYEEYGSMEDITVNSHGLTHEKVLSNHQRYINRR